MADDLQDMKERVGWCYGQVTILGAEIDTFLKSGAHKVSHEVDAVTGEATFFVERVKPIPKSLVIHSGLVIHELRATLDSLACALAARNGATPKNVYFAISADEAAFKKDGLGNKLKKLSPGDQATMASLKPWADGSPMLHALHVADLMRKHQRLILTNSGLGNLGIREMNAGRMQFLGTGPIGAQKRAFMKLSAGSYINADIGVEVNFSEPAGLEGHPVATVLRDFVSLTKSIVERFD